MKAKQLIASTLLREGLRYVEKDPEKNIPRLINWADKIAVKERHKNYVKAVREIWEDTESNWHGFMQRLIKEVNPNVQKKTLINFLVNTSLQGIPLADKMEEKHSCHIPWAVLMDPTAACNLNCLGCWAEQYNSSDELSKETLDRIINEGKELGTYMYIYSGGEPLLRKGDLLDLAEKHPECMFLAFTNGTLIDEKLAEELARVGNFTLAISIEGFEEKNDLRRGQGTFKKILEGMEYLKKHGVIYGFSTCYHSKNVYEVGSPEYLDYMIEKGCIFGWYFTYMPLGKNADLSLLVSPEQRKHMRNFVKESRNHKPIFTIDFWNDGDLTQGCIAAGRHFLHINARGDVEPCAFIHYSNVNIKETSLVEALQSPLFMEYYQNMPFNDNHLRPCPLLDNPDMLKGMVMRSGACSTQLKDRESVQELTDKCQEAAQNWGKLADEIWQGREKKPIFANKKEKIMR